MCSRAIGTMSPSIHWKIKINLRIIYGILFLSPEFRSLNINNPNVLTFTWVKHSNLATTFDSCLNLDVGFIIFQQVVESVPSLIKSLPQCKFLNGGGKLSVLPVRLHHIIAEIRKYLLSQQTPFPYHPCMVDLPTFD